MAATYMLAAGRIQPSGAEVAFAWSQVADHWQQADREVARLVELMAWKEEEQRELPFHCEIIIWLENHGYMVDLISGEVQQLEPLQAYIEEAQDDTFLDVMEYHEEIDWNRRGGWL